MTYLVIGGPIPYSLLLLGTAAMLFGLYSAFSPEIKASTPRQRWMVLLLTVLVVSVAAIRADQPYVDQCSEAFLRQICGDWWQLCWYTSGCYLLP